MDKGNCLNYSYHTSLILKRSFSQPQANDFPSLITIANEITPGLYRSVGISRLTSLPRIDQSPYRVQQRRQTPTSRC